MTKKILVFFFLIVCMVLNGRERLNIALSFIPFETQNIVCVNLQKYFFLYDFNDLYKLGIVDAKKKDNFLKVLSTIMEKSKIDSEKDLHHLSVSNNHSINLKNPGKLFFDSVFVLKLSYNLDKLESAILSTIKEKTNFEVSKDHFKSKRIFLIKKDKIKFSVFFFDNNTIILGSKKKIIKYYNVFTKKKEKSILQNKKVDSALKFMSRDVLFSYYFEFSDFFKNILSQKDDVFKMDLQKIKNIEGFADSDKATWVGEINLISSGNKKSNNIAVKSLRKLLGMTAMGGYKYIELVKKIDINTGKYGIQIFFTFDIE